MNNLLLSLVAAGLVIWCLAASSLSAAAETGKPGACVLSIGGKAVTAATYAVVTPDEPTPQEAFGAGDLAEHLWLLTGQRLAVVRQSDLPGHKTPIVVGRCETLLKKLKVDADLADLGEEGIVIRSAGPALVLTGNRRGVLYAVYCFLEDSCGIRWLTPDCTVIPRSGEIRIGELAVRYKPPLEYRSTDYPCSRPGDWAVRNRLNGTQTRLDARHGGKVSYSHFVHTFNSILDPAREFEKHPEYFSMIGGKRVGGRTQLCLTNPEVLAIAKKTVRRWIKEAPEATIFSVSQNDWHNPCQCPACKALTEKEGSQAGPLIHFVNAIADDIAKDYPDKLISTLAYQYTRKPPLHVRPRPNVCVRLCSIECCFAHPLARCPVNASFVNDIRRWHRICNRLYIWDYVINYNHSVMPFPNLRVLRPNIRFFIDNGVTGVYEEACYFSPSSELAELRTWILAKTLWKPDYDTDKAIDEFLAGYYGPAAGNVRKYIDLIHKQVADHADWHVNIRTPPTAPYLAPNVIAKAETLFDAAEAAVKGDPTLLRRVRIARLPVRYVRIATAPAVTSARPTTQAARAAQNLAKMIDEFEAVARQGRLTMLRENRRSGNIDAWLAAMRQKLPPPAKAKPPDKPPPRP